jgi:hypothetical protein
MDPINKARFEQDLWPNKKKSLFQRAMRTREGQTIRLSLGEAETLATKEVEREIRQRSAMLGK